MDSAENLYRRVFLLSIFIQLWVDLYRFLEAVHNYPKIKSPSGALRDLLWNAN